MRLVRLPRRTPALFLLVILAGVPCASASLRPQASSPQDTEAVLRDKLTDLSDQVKDRDERLELRRAVIAQQRFMLISLVLFTALLGASLIVLRLRAGARQRALHHDLIRTRQQALSLQMNPHFLFNTLGSLQAFVLKNDRQNSNLYLTRFSQLMRLVLAHADEDEVDVEEELAGLRLYLELQHLRFGDRFHYDILTESGIDLTSLRMPPFLVQPFVENAIHHGLLPRKVPGRLRVELKRHGQGVLWVIEDDGIGRAEARGTARHAGGEVRPHATEITRRRVDLLNALSPGRFSIATDDLRDAEGRPAGTRVAVFVKGGLP